jgi:hypothetical protein
MTLIVDFVSRSAVTQLSDRFVTLPDGNPHDQCSNKTVIYTARDALVSVSYSGIAYIENLQTDVYLASRLSGLDSSVFEFAGSGKRYQYRLVGIDLALDRLCLQLQEAFSGLSSTHQDQDLTLNIVGWQWKDSDLRRALRDRRGLRTLRPVSESIRKVRNDIVFERYKRVGRRWNSMHEYIRSMAGSGAMEIDKHLCDLALIPPIEDVEIALSGLFPIAYKLDGHVGPSALCVTMVPVFQDGTISRITEPFCRIRFFRNNTSLTQEKSLSLPGCGPIMYYAPFILMPGLVIPPMMMTHAGWEMRTTFFRVMLEAENESEKITGFYMAVQQRPPAPGMRRRQDS